MYDLWIPTSYLPEEHLAPLAVAFPVLAQSEVRTQLLQRSPGFLGLNVPKSTAYQIRRRLKQHDVRGMVVEIAYRQPPVPKDQAFGIARHIIQRIQVASHVGHQFAPITFSYEHAMWWLFAAPCHTCIATGRIPGTIFAAIDKRDGHVWEDKEMEQFFGGQETEQSGFT